MSSVRSTRRAVAEHMGLCALGLIALVWLVACGDYQPAATPQPGSTAGPNSAAETPSSLATPTWEPITRENPSGVVAGIVFREPVSLDEARSIAEELRGDAISLYRTDYAFVKPDAWTAATGPVGGDGTTPTTAPVEPSRFAYVDAGKIRERRVTAIQTGLSPPITGWSISEGYWEHWEDQWARAQDPGVRFEALGLYVSASAVDALRADPRFRAVVIVPHRRTDSLSQDYAGELLLESEAFPPGVLMEPDAKSANTSLTEKEIQALVDELKAGSPDIGWAELMRGVDTVKTRRVVAVVEPVGTGFLLHMSGDPGRRMIPDVFPPDVREGEDPRYQDLPRRAFSDVDAGSTVALWGYPAQASQHPGTKNDAETETVEGFRVVYWEWQGPPTRVRGPSTTAAPTTTAPGQETWDQVMVFAGNADLRSPTFALSGAPVRFSCELVGKGNFGLSIITEGLTHIEDGGENICGISIPGTFVTPPRSIDPGGYYLHVTASGFDWTVRVEEQR